MRGPWHKSEIPIERSAEGRPVPIVADASIASRGIGEGRMIPLVILDTATRPDIDEVARAHRRGPPGDAIANWGRRSRGSTALLLIIRFERPVRSVVLLEFDPASQGILIDQAVKSQAIYIQPGRPGDRLKNTMSRPRVLVEVPSEDFAEEWETMFHRAMATRFKERGLRRKAAKSAAARAIDMMRQVNNVRMPPG